MYFDPSYFGVLFPRRSTVLRFSCFVFLDCGHPCFLNFYFTIPADVVRVRSYVDRHFDPACVRTNAGHDQ